MDAILDILTLGGTHALPRRACLTAAGRVEEVGYCAGAPREVHILSSICEVVCQSTGKPVYSRDPCVLLKQCLEENDPRAWSALASDILRGMARAADCSVYLEDNMHVTLSFMHHLKSSTSPEHAASILRVLATLLPALSDDCLAVFQSSLRNKLGANALRVYAAQCRLLPPSLRVSALKVFGSILQHVSELDTIMADVLMMEAAHASDIVSCMAHSSAGLNQNKEQVRTFLLEMLRRTHSPLRGPVILLLAKVGCSRELAIPIIMAALETPQTREAALVLANRVFPRDSLEGSLARAQVAVAGKAGPPAIPSAENGSVAMGVGR